MFQQQFRQLGTVDHHRNSIYSFCTHRFQSLERRQIDPVITHIQNEFSTGGEFFYYPSRVRIDRGP